MYKYPLLIFIPPLPVSLSLHSPLHRKAARAVSAMALVLLLSSVFTAVFSVSSESTLAARTECSDGIDNDGNGFVDYPPDAGCTSIDDNYEGTTSNGNFITVTDERDTVQPSGALVYVITLKQQRETARNVNVTLDLPFQANITSASDGGSVGTDRVTWTNVSVYQNATRVLTVNVNVRPDAKAGQYLVARARAGGSESIDTTLVQGYIAPEGNLYNLSLTDGREYVQPGQESTYTVSVRNTSSNPQTSDVKLALPFETYFISASDDARKDSYTLTWRNITLQPNEQRSFTATVQIDPLSRRNILLRAKAFVGTVIAIDQTVSSVNGLPSDAISASITDNRKTAKVGEVLNYIVKVTNNSDVVATNVSVDAGLPLYGEFVGATEGGYWDGSNVRWLILQVAPHDTRTLEFGVRVRSDAPIGTVQNVSVSADGSVSRDFTTIGLVADVNGGVSQGEENVLFRKSADRGEAVPGGEIRYTLFVRNTLDHAITDATILDRYDSEFMSLATYENPENLASQSQGEMTWIVPVLQPGESWVTTYVLSVAKDAPNAVELNNVASLRGTGLESVSLTSRVITSQSGVLRDFPATGAGMDSLLAFLLAGIAVATGSAQKKLAFV